jgi:hypothetical protein
MRMGSASVRALALALAFAVAAAPLARSAEPCDFRPSFSRADEHGTRKVTVYEAVADAALKGAKPLAFISDLKVNTDGTRISYKVDDPRAKNGAINNILNAMHSGHAIAEFEQLAKNDWRPLAQTWVALSASVIERNRETGKPCVDADNYLVSKTADVSVAGGWRRVGDCDQAKWIDALSIPAIVVPSRSEFQMRKNALLRNIAIVMTLGEPQRIAYGIIGDAGPVDEIGEASVAMNRILNGLPEDDRPKSARDAINRFQAPKSVVLVFPGAANRLDYPITPEHVRAEAKARFDAWGGKDRLDACLEDIPESGR